MEQLIAHTEKNYVVKTENYTVYFDSKKELMKQIKTIFSTHSDVSVFYGDELISHQKKDTYEFWIP